MKTKFCKTASSSSIQLRFGGAWRRISLALLFLMLTTMTAWADDVKYIDENGNEATADATKIPSGNFTWQDDGDLWFYISGKDEVESYLDFNQWDWGTINLIICDDAERTIKYLNSNKTLNIYGQKNNTGKLTTNDSDYNGCGIHAEFGLSIYGGNYEISNASNGIACSGHLTISGSNITLTGATDNGISTSDGNITIIDSKINITGGGISASDGDYNVGGCITINGSEITINGGQFSSTGGDILINDGTITVDGYNGFVSTTGNITINGGKITATATGDYSYGISAVGDVNINGGIITASATGSGSYGIAGTTITLGDATIKANSYETYGSFKIADGLTLSDGSKAYSGTLTEEQIAALANKTLKKLPAFIDLTATIVWVDNENQDGKRPASVTVSLKANGTQIDTYELNESGEWKYTVNKPSLSNGTLIVYTWDVPNMPNGYGLTGNSADGTTTTLTLTLQQCGENVAWNYDASSKTLTISGTGAMDDYSSADDQPWSSFSGEIESVVINKDVTSIGSYAFTGCTALESVTYEAESQLEAIGASAFAGCSSLTSINIPADVTSIGASAFADCTVLGSVTYAAGTQLETIGESAFAACSSLASVIIPVGVTSIGASAFENCASLTSVTAYPQTPPALGEDAFNDINGNVAFTVRNEDYKTADGWSAWASKMTILDPSQFLPYIDANGNEAFCTNATPIPTGDFSYVDDGELWYYVSGTYTRESSLNFYQYEGGTINIILCDDATLTAGSLTSYTSPLNIYRQEGNTGTININGGSGSGISAYNSLTINGGTINFSGSSYEYGIYSDGNITLKNCTITTAENTTDNIFSQAGNIIINGGKIAIAGGGISAAAGDDNQGGNITITDGDIDITGGGLSASNLTINSGDITIFNENGYGVTCGDITINNGKITVEENSFGGISATNNVIIEGGEISVSGSGISEYDKGNGIYSGGNITINGGTVTAKSTNGAGIAGNNITLGDATTTASSYKVDEYSGSFKIADGLFMTDGSKAYSGTLYDGNNTSNGKFEDLETLNNALANKTLQKLPDYIDLTARIVWIDNNNQYSKRPTSVTVSLMANGVKVENATFELSGNNEWNCTVPNQPSLNEGELIEYTWEVNDVSGWYELSESAEATTTTLTFSIRQCGQEGTNVIWCYDPDSKTLTVSGTGYMMYYASIQNADESWSNGAPWKDFSNEIEAVVIENGITYVGSNTFAHCPNISSVTLPTDGIYEIGPGAFADCTSLTSIDIPMSINTIGNQAFAGCSSLTVTIGYGEASSFTIGTEVFPVTAVIIVPEASLSGYQTATGWSTYQIVPATRTFFAANSSNQWMTWCDKNAYTKPEGVTVYTVSGVDDNTVSTSEVSGDVIPAYTPVLLYRSTAGEDAVKATFNVVGTAPEGYNGFVETGSGNAIFLGNPGETQYAIGSGNIYAISDFSDIQSYVLHNGNFVAVDEDGGIASHRCWLNVTKSTTNNAPMLRISLGDATAIENCQLSTVHTQLNGWYGVDGRKLDKQPTTKGLFINNGKKYIIK